VWTAAAPGCAVAFFVAQAQINDELIERYDSHANNLSAPFAPFCGKNLSVLSAKIRVIRVISG
jgi:hypothetical protein